jgi:putative oxidoreductase
VRSVLAKTLSPGRFSTRRAGWALTVLRWASGAVFIVFGAGKFVDHASEASSFHTYGLPSPDLFTDAIGVLELTGGVLLVVGLTTRPAAALLAGDMVGAIIVPGLLLGETVSLTLAPAMLAAMLVLLALGPGRLSLDAELARRGSRARDRRRLTGLASRVTCNGSWPR